MPVNAPYIIQCIFNFTHHVIELSLTPIHRLITITESDLYDDYLFLNKIL